MKETQKREKRERENLLERAEEAFGNDFVIWQRETNKSTKETRCVQELLINEKCCLLKAEMK